MTQEVKSRVNGLEQPRNVPRPNAVYEWARPAPASAELQGRGISDDPRLAAIQAERIAQANQEAALQRQAEAKAAQEQLEGDQYLAQVMAEMKAGR